MSYEKGDGSLPSYEESLSDRVSTSGNVHRGQQIIDQLTNVRARHIREIIEAVVYPRVEEQAIYGIASTTIALIPSDAVAEKPVSEFDFGDQKGEEGLELVGFASDETVQQVRLKGPLNRTQFWRQAGVVDELQRTLQGKLATAPFAPVPPQAQPQFPRPGSESEASTPAQRRSVLRRKQESLPRTSSTTSVEQVTDRGVEEPASGFRARVALEEICFRTVSDFGLYETISRPAVLIRIVAGL